MKDSYDHPGSPMHSWPIQRRLDSWTLGLIEAICKHGVGHPIPESIEVMTRKTGQKGWGVHGCDGCCAKKA